MAKAIWNGTILAESDACVILEGNHYFPPDSVYHQYLRETATHTTCPWKGEASYYDIVVGNTVNADAAWYYPSPFEQAKHIAGYIAFWKGVSTNEY